MNRIAALIGAIIFLIVGGIAFYRLFVGFRFTIGDMEVGQTTTFFIFVVCAALSLMLFRQSAVRD